MQECRITSYNVCYTKLLRDHPSHRGGHRGRGHGGDPARADRHRHDQSVFHTLLARHAEIRRKVTQTAQGIDTLTTADRACIAVRTRFTSGCWAVSVEPAVCV